MTAIFPASAKNRQRYLPLDLVSGLNPELELLMHEKSFNLDLSKTQNVRVRLKVNDLYKNINSVSSFKINVYEIISSDRKFVSSQNLTIKRGTAKSRILSLDAGYFASPVKNIEIDIFDTASNLINSYEAQLMAINLDTQVLATDAVNLSSADCDLDTFDDCQLDYLFQKITFEAKPQRQISTRVLKGEDGLYKVTIPVPRTSFNYLGRKVRNKKSTVNISNNSTGGTITDFGETINISAVNIGSSLANSFNLSSENNQLNVNDSLYLDTDGRLGIGIQDPLAWLDIRGGDSETPSLILNPGTLIDSPKNGALEFDGENLYFTKDGIRSELGATGPAGPSGPQGPQGPQGAAGTVQVLNGSTINGSFTVSDALNARLFNGDVFNGGLFNGNGAGLTNLNASAIVGVINNPSITNGYISNTRLDDPTLNGNIIVNGPISFTNNGYINDDTLINGNLVVDEVHARLFNGQVFNGGIFNGTFFGDGSNLDGLAANNGSIHDLTVNNGNLNNVVIQNGSSILNSSFGDNDLNGTVSFLSNGSLQDSLMNGSTVIVDGSLTITTSTPQDGFVLTTDINGVATWQDLSTLDSNGDDLGDHTATQALDMNGFSIIAADSINGTTANFTTVNATNFNGGTFNGITIEGTDNVLNGVLSFGASGLLEDAVLNGSTIINNGSLTITTNTPVDGYVLTTNAFGAATWQNLSTLTSNGDDLGNHTATEALKMATYSIQNAGNVNGVTANFTTVNATNFNGGTFNGTFLGNGAGLTGIATSVNGSITNTTINNGTVENTSLTINNGDVSYTNGATITINNGTSFNYGNGATTNYNNGSNLFFNNGSVLTFNGGMIENGTLNGTTTITNGDLFIRTSTPTNGYVLTTDDNGLATWVSAAALSVTGDNLGDHTATQALDMNGFSLNGALSVNGTTANFTTVNATNFNGGTFNGTFLGDGSGLTGIGSASASGSNGYIQFYNGGSLNSSSNLFWNINNGYMSLGHSAPDTILDVNGFLTMRASSTASTGALEYATMTHNGIGNYSSFNKIVDKPATLSENDIMIAVMSLSMTSSATITPPAGWTEITTLGHSTASIKTGLYWKKASGAEPADYTFTISSSIEASAYLFVYNGANLSNPIAGYASDEGSATLGSPDVSFPAVPSVTGSSKTLRILFNEPTDMNWVFNGTSMTSQSYVYRYIGQMNSGNANTVVYDKDETGAISSLTGNFAPNGGAATTRYLSFTLALAENGGSLNYPSDPDNGAAAFWLSENSSIANNGDYMVKINSAGTTKTIKIIDFNNGRLAVDDLSANTSFNGLTLNGLTANSLVATNASKELISETNITVSSGNVGIGSGVTPSALLDVGGGTMNIVDGTDDLLVKGDVEVDGTVYATTFNGSFVGDISSDNLMLGTATDSSVANAGAITVTKAIMKVKSNAGIVTLSDPQVAYGTDGQLVVLKGLSNTDAITFIDGNGLSLTDGLSFTLGNKDTLTLIYDSGDSEWIEVSRSDK